MSDPERLLSAQGDGTELERELLGAVRDVGPRGDAKERAWAGIAARAAAVSALGAGAAAVSSAATASSAPAATLAKAGGASMLTKLVVAAAVTGGVVSGGYYVQRGAAPRVAPAPAPAQAHALRTPASPALVAPSAIAPVEVVDVAPQSEARAPSAARPPRVAAKRSPMSAAEQLAAESALLTEARAKLRSGDSAGASDTLDRLRIEFPNGVLAQEREVLTIEVLAQRGQRAAAAEGAARFIRAHPKSPHAEALKRFLERP